MFLNNRYHDPSLGSFISVDPLVTQTGEPYIYASGNPTNLSDWSGLEPRPIHDKNWKNSNPLWSGYESSTSAELDWASEPWQVPSYNHSNPTPVTGDELLSDLAAVSDVTPEISGHVSDSIGVVAAVCLGAAAFDKDSSPVTLGCAGAAGGVSYAAALIEAGADVTGDGALQRCTTAGLAVELLVPGGDLGEAGYHVTLDVIKAFTGSAVDFSC